MKKIFVFIYLMLISLNICIYQWESIKYDANQGVVKAVYPIIEYNKITMYLSYQDINSRFLSFDLSDKKLLYFNFNLYPLITAMSKFNNKIFIYGFNPTNNINGIITSNNLLDFDSYLEIGKPIIISMKEINSKELIIIGVKSYTENNLPFIAKINLEENKLYEKNYSNINSDFFSNIFALDSNIFFVTDNIGNIFQTNDSFN